MHMKNPSSHSDAARLVLDVARRLHRAAMSESLAVSLPVLRRILASATLRNISLAELRRRNQMVQRKHILRTLAIEVGFSSWEEYRRALDTMTADQLQHFDLVYRGAGYPNLWFPSLAQAREHAAVNGGIALRLGEHGVVLAESPAPERSMN